MKNFIYLIVICFSLISCGGSGGDEPNPPPPEPTNTKPTTPSNVAPIDNLLCIDNSVVFEWSASSDVDGDMISYQLQVATNNEFSEDLETFNNIISTSKQLSLDTGVAYYWRVKAVDGKNESSDYSSVFKFYTEGEGESNHLPFLPDIGEPKINDIVKVLSITLSWTASDTDNDSLVYDVYFDTVNPPMFKKSENQSDVSLTVDLSSATNYFWKVVVKDDKGGVTHGQVWSFKTD